MLKKKKVCTLVSVIIIIIIIISVYKYMTRSMEYSKTFFAMTTVNEIQLYDVKKSQTDKLFNKCYDILKSIDNKMSPEIPKSEINKVAKEAGKSYVKVSNDTYTVVKDSIRYCKMSNGYFDTSIRPITALWAIGTDKARVPEKSEIDKLLPLVSYKNILLDDKNSSIKLVKPGMALDLGGIAKGYAADKIVEYLKSQGVKKAVINLGGDLFVLGNKPDGSAFNIGIQDPDTKLQKTIGSSKVQNLSIVTSGVNERYIEKNGKHYHHIMNPFNGYPFDNGLVQVTIVADNATKADSLATAVFGLGFNNGLKLINRLHNVEAMFITKDNKIYLSKGMNFNLTDNKFKVIKEK